MDSTLLILQPCDAVTSDGAEASIDARALLDACFEVRLVETDGDGTAVEAVALQLVLLAPAVGVDGVVFSRAASRIDGCADGKVGRNGAARNGIRNQGWWKGGIDRWVGCRGH